MTLAKTSHGLFAQLSAKCDTPLTTTHSDFKSWAAVKIPRRKEQTKKVSTCNVCANR